MSDPRHRFLTTLNDDLSLTFSTFRKSTVSNRKSDLLVFFLILNGRDGYYISRCVLGQQDTSTFVHDNKSCGTSSGRRWPEIVLLQVIEFFLLSVRIQWRKIVPSVASRSKFFVDQFLQTILINWKIFSVSNSRCREFCLFL